MEAFEDLKSQWDGQSSPRIPEGGVQKIVEKMKNIKGKQRIMNIVLSLTGMVLIGFFFYISAYRFQTVMTGLLLMIMALIVRIVVEMFSINTINKLDVSETAVIFKKRLLKYYNNRLRVHYIFTPIIILLYCIGFVMLLPSFKANLSSGFYTYIWVSSIVLLVFFGVFIGKQAKKELDILRQLNE